MTARQTTGFLADPTGSRKAEREMNASHRSAALAPADEAPARAAESEGPLKAPDGGSWTPDLALIRTRFLELSRRRGLLVGMVAGNLGPTIVTIIVLIVRHGSHPWMDPTGTTWVAAAAETLWVTGTLTAVFLGAIAGSADVTSRFFRALVTTGRSRLALYLARFPAGIALIAAVIAPTFLLAAACSDLMANPDKILDPRAPLHVVFALGGWLLLVIFVVFAITLGISTTIGSEAVTVLVTVGLLIGLAILATVLVTDPGWPSWLRFVDFEWIFKGMQPAISLSRPASGIAYSMPVWQRALALAIWVAAPVTSGAYRAVHRDA